MNTSPPPWDQQYYSHAKLSKDYFGESLLTLVMYIVFWLPGFILNIIFLMDARHKAETGYDVSGKGCLWVLLFFNGAIPLMMLCFVPLVIFALMGG